MFKVLAITAALVLGATATADQFKTIKESSNANRSEYSVSYPEFLPTSVTGYKAINENVKKTIVENACGEPGKDEPGFYYSVDATVVALNSTYVGVKVVANDYCGGAHPNYTTYYMTYASDSGKKLEVEEEFGFLDYDSPDYDYEKNEARRKLVAELLIDRIPVGQDASECYTGSRQEKLEQLVSFYPVVQGLAKNKTVVLGLQPPHVATPCGFEVRFEYEDIKHLLNTDSYLHNWLR